MNQFTEYLHILDEEFGASGFTEVNVAPPAGIAIPSSCLDMTLEIRVREGLQSTGGELKGFLTLSASKETFRRLGLILLGFAVITSTRDFELKRKGNLGVGRSIICLNLSGDGADGRENGADKLIVGGEYNCLKYFDFIPTSIRYFYERSDASAGSREWAPVSRYDRPCFAFHKDEKSLRGEWVNGAEKLPLKLGAVTMGNTASALLRLGGFLLDFSHPDNDVEFLELEQAFEQVAPYSYDMNFVLTGTQSEFLVFG